MLQDLGEEVLGAGGACFGGAEELMVYLLDQRRRVRQAARGGADQRGSGC
jgi:hypothetical protein